MNRWNESWSLNGGVKGDFCHWILFVFYYNLVELFFIQGIKFPSVRLQCRPVLLLVFVFRVSVFLWLLLPVQGWFVVVNPSFHLRFWQGSVIFGKENNHTPWKLLRDNVKKTLSSTPSCSTWSPADWKHSAVPNSLNSTRVDPTPLEWIRTTTVRWKTKD